MTLVAALIKDPSGNLYRNATVECSFLPNAPINSGQFYAVSGSPFQQFAIAATDSFGNLAILLTGNDIITPAGSTWRFSVLDATRTVGFSTSIAIAGSTQDVSAALLAAAAVLPSLFGNATVNNLSATTISAASVNVVTHVGGNISTADIGTQINTAYANCPAAPSSCRIVVDPNPTGAAYNFSTPIVMNTVGKYAVLDCAAPTSTNLAAAGGLNYTPTTATVAITMDFGTTGAQNTSAGIVGCHFTNNQCFTTGGCGSSATGLKVGNTNFGLGGGTIYNTTFQGFGTALDDTNPNTGAFFTMVNVQFWQNTVGWLEGSHDIVMLAGGCGGCGTCIKINLASDNPELYITDAVLSNQTALDFDATNVTSGFVIVHAKGVHMERGVGRGSHAISGRFSIDWTGGTIEDNNASTDWMITLNNSVVELVWPHVTISAPSTSFIIANANVRGVASLMTTSTNLSTKAAVVTGASAGQFTVEVIQPGGAAALPWFYESQFQQSTGSTSAPSYSFQTSPNSGLYMGSSNPKIASGGADQISFGGGATGATVTNGGCFSYATTSNPDGAVNASICKASAGVLTLGSGQNLTDATLQFGSIGKYGGVTTVAGGVPALVAKADLTAQAANVGVTLLYAVPANGAGMYRITAALVVTQAATTSSTLPSANVVWTDNDSGVVEPANTFTATNSANTVGSVSGTPLSGNAIINAKASTNISFATTAYASSGATPMQYAVHFKLEYLGN